MTLDEFRALKVGDRIRNPMSDSAGVISERIQDRRTLSIYVQWEGSPKSIHFTEHQTAWMHWVKESNE
jgi:hypothetical protein